MNAKIAKVYLALERERKARRALARQCAANEAGDAADCHDLIVEVNMAEQATNSAVREVEDDS